MWSSLSGSSRTKVPSSVNGSSMHGGDGVVRRARPGRPARPPRAGGPLGAPVGTTKSRWRTRAKPQTAPTRATTAPMSIRWFKVLEKPTW